MSNETIQNEKTYERIYWNDTLVTAFGLHDPLSN